MYYIGVDLGGTNIAIGIVNEQYEIVKKGSTPTKPERGADPKQKVPVLIYETVHSAFLAADAHRGPETALYHIPILLF